MASGPVEFSNVRVEDISAVRAVVRFDTNIPTSCEANYGLAADAMTETATDPNMAEGQLAVDHDVPLEDLQPGTVYFWKAKATNANGETYFSDQFQFSTLPAAASDALVNAALLDQGSSVTAVSSNFGGGDDDSTWGANHAIDGSMATEWATNGDGDEAWLELDLGSERELVAFGFRSRKMADGSSIVKSVSLVFDGATHAGPYMTPDPDQRYEFDLPEPITARRIRLEAVETTGGNTGAKEIQFFVEN